MDSSHFSGSGIFRVSKLDLTLCTTYFLLNALMSFFFLKGLNNYIQICISKLTISSSKRRAALYCLSKISTSQFFLILFSSQILNFDHKKQSIDPEMAKFEFFSVEKKRQILIFRSFEKVENRKKNFFFG